MESIFDSQALIGLVTLTFLEIVLGIDNIIFISIFARKLPKAQQDRARKMGLALAMIMRILLLLSLSRIARLTEPLFTVFHVAISGRALILLGGGLFLLAKSTYEIHERLEGETAHAAATGKASFSSVLTQIILLDIVFSLDSVITAVGMANQLWVMVTAVIISVVIMLWASGPISAFVNRHPTVKMLALSFLLLIGFSLMTEGLELHIPKGYIYFAMAFTVFVEMLNLRLRAKAEPVSCATVRSFVKQRVRQAKTLRGCLRSQEVKSLRAERSNLSRNRDCFVVEAVLSGEKKTEHQLGAPQFIYRNSCWKRPRSRNQVSPDQSSTPSLSVTTKVRPLLVIATPSGLSVIQPLVALRSGHVVH